MNLKTGSDEIFHQNLGLSSLVQCLSKRWKEFLLHYLPVTQRKLAEGWDGVLTAGLRICALNNNGTPLGQKVLLQHARCISSPSLSTFISCRSSSGGIWKLRSLLLYKCNLFYTCAEYTLFPSIHYRIAFSSCAGPSVPSETILKPEVFSFPFQAGSYCPS